ncbi:hypothetical protein [Tautonia plasticadhaerens]|uniref:Lipoprotein n=1 Tax=Tautonia plasticadhaerens TaxID=2527974 RepID=A0A518GV77_9BACT|nr:hypothetical protein [Tautonia plasticadhaerens]QDV32495.1 hypothetical protein ElP_03280 [Tautonia plasticadhaerens]
MARLLIASTLIALAALGCGRSAGLPPTPEGRTRASDDRIGDRDLNPRTDPEHFPAVEERTPGD